MGKCNVFSAYPSSSHAEIVRFGKSPLDYVVLLTETMVLQRYVSNRHTLIDRWMSVRIDFLQCRNLILQLLVDVALYVRDNNAGLRLCDGFQPNVYISICVHNMFRIGSISLRHCG